MRLRVALVVAIALASSFVQAQVASASSADGNGNQTAGTPAAGMTIQPNIGTPQKPGHALFSPDKRVLATSDGKRIEVWDIATGRLLRTLEHFAYNTAMAFAPDGRAIYAGYKDGSVKVWDPETGALTATMEAVAPSDEVASGVPAIAIDPKREILFTGGQDGTIAAFELPARRKLFSFNFGKDQGRNCAIAALGLSGDGSRLIGVSSLCGAKWFSLAPLKTVRSFKLPAANVSYAGYLGDDLVLARNSGNGCSAEAWILDPSRRTAASTPVISPAACAKEAADGGVLELTAHAVGGTLFAGRAGVAGLDVWDLKTRTLKRRLPWPEKGSASVIAISRDMELAAVSDGEAIEIRKLETGERVRQLGSQGHAAPTVFLSADGQTLALMRTGERGKQLATLGVGAATPAFTGYEAGEDVYFSGLSAAQGKAVALEKRGDEQKGHTTQALHIFDAGSGRETLKVPLTGDDAIRSATISPDGSKVVLIGEKARLLDTATGQVLQNFVAPQSGRDAGGDHLRSAAFSQDGARLALAWEDAEVWDTAGLQLIHRVPQGGNRCTSLLLSADGKLLVCGSGDAGIHITDIETGKAVRSFERELVAGHAGTASLALSPDGKLIAAGPGQRATSSGDLGRETGIHVWDVAGGKLRFILRGHEDNVYAFTPDGRWLMSGSPDGTIRYWDAKTGAGVATFASAKDSRWAMISNKGFFAASANAAGLLSVVRGYRAIGIGQLWQSLYNPDLLREVLAGDPNGEVRQASAVLDLGKVMDSGPAPAVEIVKPASGTKSSTDLVTVSARIEDRGKGIGRVEWRVNGITVSVTGAPTGTGPDHEVQRELALDPGDNSIEVVAYNAGNLLASPPGQATITFTGSAGSVKPQLHILAIGIDAYEDKGWAPPGSKVASYFAPLGAAVGDAKAFAEEVRLAGSRLYSAVHVRTVLDAEASPANLDRIVGEMSAGISARDTFVLFAAGHGYSHEGRFYLIPQDYQGGIDPEALKTRAIGQDRLQDWIANRIEAKKAIILLDTCESGALFGGHGRSRMNLPASEAAIGRLHEATGRPVLTAATEGQGAIETAKPGHGVFTLALLKALHEADANNNGLIEVSELAAYVQDIVPKLVAGGEGRPAIPRGAAGGTLPARSGTADSDFVLVERLP